MKRFLKANRVVACMFFVFLCTLSFACFPGYGQARDLFYFLVGNTLQAYSRDGIRQKTYDLPIYPGANTYPIGVATDGVHAWIAYSYDYDFIDRMVLADNPTTEGNYPLAGQGFNGGIAVAGSTILLSRNHIDPTIPNRIQRYQDGSGTFLNEFQTGATSYPGSLQASGSTLLVASNAKVKMYSTEGSFLREFAPGLFPGWQITAVCSDNTTVWVFYTGNTGYAFDMNGNRTASQDIVFEGLSGYLDVYFAWGADEQNIFLSASTVDFGSVIVDGESDKEVTVRNIGNLPLSLSSFTLSDTVNFDVSALTGALAPGASQTINISYHPTDLNRHGATLAVNSDDPDQPAVTITLQGTAKAGQFYVDGSNAPGGDGQSWATAFASVNEAMADNDVLEDSDIWVKEGSYGPVTVSKRVKIYGGFIGTENSLMERNPVQNRSFLDGGGTSVPLQITSGAAMSGTAAGLLDGFTIVNGNNTTGYYGGGVVIEGDGFTLSHNTIVNNVNITSPFGHNYGGGISINANQVTISDCTISGNLANDGAGVYLYWGKTATVERCLITGNLSTTDGGSGGGLLSEGLNLRVLSSLVHGNKTTGTGSGSGIAVSQGTGEIINCTVTGNNNVSQDGGNGIRMAGGIIKNSIVWFNGSTDFTNSGKQITGTSSVTYSAIQETGYGDPLTGAADPSNHNMRLAPGFVDADGPDNDLFSWQDNDYRLIPGSSCIDAGDGNDAPGIDLFGNHRFDDANIPNSGTGTPDFVDIGAHERQSSTPTRLYVDAAATGLGTGESWQDALTSINDAARMALNGAEVWVRSGTYHLIESIAVDRAARLLGGFNGTETISSQRNWNANQTIIHGQEIVPHCLVIADDATIDGFTITGGNAVLDYSSADASFGGGILIQGCSPTIVNSTIQGNRAVAGGGGIWAVEAPSLTIDRCKIIGNAAIGGGDYPSPLAGGLGLKMSSGATVINSIIAGNSASSGGGALAWNSQLQLINCTVVGNRAFGAGGGGAGGGIAEFWTTSGSPITVVNSIVWDNSAPIAPQILDTTDPSVTFSDVQGGFAGTGNIDVPPQFNNGGSWNDDLWIDGDYLLATESLCVNAGTSMGAPAVDIALTIRPQSDGIDLGAYETIFPLPLAGDVDGDQNVDLRDGILSLQVLTGEAPDGISRSGDVDGDQRIGMAEALYILDHMLTSP